MQSNLINSSGAALTRGEMKKVTGGGALGSCTYRCPNGNRECTSATGRCSGSPALATKQWIKCDDTRYDC